MDVNTALRKIAAGEVIRIDGEIVTMPDQIGKATEIMEFMSKHPNGTVRDLCMALPHAIDLIAMLAKAISDSSIAFPDARIAAPGGTRG